MLSFFRVRSLSALALMLVFHEACASTALPPRAPLIVAPAIEGLLICDEVTNQPMVKTAQSAEHWCVEKSQNSGARLTKFLDELEPKGAKGKVQLGYTLTIQLLTLYKKSSGMWIIDQKKVAAYLNLIKSVDRPVVIYLASGHFDTKSDLASELAQDPVNLLHFPSGPTPVSNYLGHSIIPFTLLTTENIPVNKYRFAALRHVTREIKNLPSPALSKIKAVTLAGEVHHMFPDFENGMGNYTGIKTTDYSKESQNRFHIWLENKYGSIAKLNSATGLSYKTFREITAPFKNIRQHSLSSFGEHYDAYADGILPFSGWLWDPLKEVTKISLHVDGKPIGDFQTGMGRLDVYRAEKSITNASTGFRFDMDFSTFKPGKYLAQIIAYKKNTPITIDERYFSIISSDRAAPPQPRRAPNPRLNPTAAVTNLRWWVDIPAANIDLYYNPIARDWNAYRNQQVKSFLGKFYRISREAGLPANLLFSHQILARANSTWNPQLFATDASISNTTPWRTGINMYGGTTHSEWTRQYLKKNNITDYGVPEYNPQQWKDKKTHSDAFLFHYKSGARFISPYYYTLVPEKFRTATDQFQIDSTNLQDGANLLEAAVKEFVKE